MNKFLLHVFLFVLKLKSSVTWKKKKHLHQFTPVYPIKIFCIFLIFLKSFFYSPRIFFNKKQLISNMYFITFQYSEKVWFSLQVLDTHKWYRWHLSSYFTTISWQSAFTTFTDLCIPAYHGQAATTLILL